MKILTICHDHPEFTPGGSEFFAHDLCRELENRDGVSSKFLGATTSRTHPEVPPGALHVEGQDHLLRTGRYDLFSMRRQDGTDWIRSLENVLARTKPDVIHLHGLDRIGAEILVVLKRFRTDARLVLTLHDFQLICPNDGLLLQTQSEARCTTPSAGACRRCFPDISVGRHAMRKAHLQSLLQVVDAFVAPSQFVKDQHVGWGLPAARIHVIPNGIPARPKPRRLKRVLPNRFAFFGTIGAHKGGAVLLEAAQRLAETVNPDLRIAFHGRLRDPSESAKTAFNDEMDRAFPVASYVGPYDRRELPLLMQAVDWVVAPSIWPENAPLVVLEAQQAGLPVICTSEGGLPELVKDGVNGIHVPRKDSAALAEAILRLSQDPALWAKLAGKCKAPKTIEASATEHFSLYSKLLERELA